MSERSRMTSTEEHSTEEQYTYQNGDRREEEPSPGSEMEIHQRKRGRGHGFLLFLCGLLIGTLLSGLIFVSPMRKALFFKDGGSGGKEASQELLNEATRQKIQLIANTIHNHYYKPKEISLGDERSGLYKGLVESLGDPYSVYYTGEELKQMMSETEGTYGGIGAMLSLDKESGYTYISGVMEKTPAEEAGIQTGDIIFKINGKSAHGMQTDEVASQIRGKEGTKVHLTLVREGGQGTIEVDLVRKKISSPTVSGKMLENHIGYLKITEFDEVTYDQYLNTFAELKGKGMKGMILDLRNNPGGNLDTVCQIARRILPKGIIVYTKDNRGKRVDYDSDGKHEIQIPLVVLVNGNSASASEILAGAIKDYHLGKLVGTTTFGKGIVQQIIDLNDGTALKLTVSDYYTPSGKNIHGIGIDPDEKVELDVDALKKDGSDNQLNKAVELLEKEMKNQK